MPKIRFPKPPAWLSKINPFKATYNPALAGGGTTGGGVMPFAAVGAPRIAVTASAGGGGIVININGGLHMC